MARTDARGGPQTRAKIAQAATRLFVEHGFDAVTVAQIAREAGVSSVTVFNHFPRKEDLYLDRAEDAAALLRAAVRERPAGGDVLTSLRDLSFRLLDDRHPLSGLDDRSVPFFRTVAGSPALVARAREIAADLQRILAEELDDDAALLAALFVAGYGAVLVETARRLIAEEPREVVEADHRRRLGRLFEVLGGGFSRS